MAATAPLKKPPYMKELIAQADSPKDASMVKKINGQSILFSSNKTTHYFQKWMAASCVLKKISSSKKFDESYRSFLNQLFPKTTLL